MLTRSASELRARATELGISWGSLHTQLLPNTPAQDGPHVFHAKKPPRPLALEDKAIGATVGSCCYRKLSCRAGWRQDTVSAVIH